MQWLDHPQLPLVLVLDAEDALVYLGFSLETRARFDDLRAFAARHGASVSDEGRGPTAASAQLRAYLAGERRGFDLPLRLLGTAFQRRAWGALCEIPYGEIRSYGQQADAMGSTPGAARAVGHANGQNPVSIVVPCHRVVGGDGRLVGFGGGVEVKRWLLELERRRSTPAWSPKPGPRRPVDGEGQLGLFGGGG